MKVDEKKKWMGQANHKFTYDRKLKKPNNTTLIEIINKEKECNCYCNKITLDKGGIYQDFGEINFVAEKNCALHYVIRIFAK